MKKFLKKVYFQGEAFICSIMFIIMLAILFEQVVLRFVFHNSNVWSEELARYLFIYIVFLASSYAVLENRPIRIDVATKLWPKPIRKYAEMLGEIILIVFSFMLAYMSFNYIKEFVYGLRVISLGFKSEMWIWWMAIPIGNFLIGVRATISFIERWIIKRPLVTRDEEEKKAETEAEKLEEFLEEVGD